MKTTTPPTPEQGNKPVARLRYGRIHATIWDNRAQGAEVPRYGVTFERRYKDAAGTWRSSQSYNAAELLLPTAA